LADFFVQFLALSITKKLDLNDYFGPPHFSTVGKLPCEIQKS